MAGVIGVSSNSFFRVRENIVSADEAIKTGMYSYAGGTAINGASYGLLLALCNIEFSATWAWGAQLFIGENNTLSLRTSIRKNGVWGEWISIK